MPGPKTAQLVGRPPVKATAQKGHPEACAHMEASIAKARQAQANLQSNRYNSNKDVGLQMCELADRTLDELVNISGANCPQRLPALRMLMAQVKAHKCSESRKGYFRDCRGSATTYGWKDDKGRWKVSPCSTPGGVRG
jgi:hypothetical protein